MKRIVTILFTLVMLPAVASADVITAYYSGIGLGTSVSGSRYNSATHAWTGFNVWAGQIEWTSDSWLGDFYSYCIDLTTPVVNPQVFDSGVPSGISSSDAALIAYLVGHNAAGVDSNGKAAGLQLAIWNVLYDSDFTVSGGDFWSGTAGAAGYANGYLASLPHDPSNTGGALFLNALNGQDQVTPVPEPATMLLFGTGAAALAVRRRRQTRNSDTEASA